MQSQCEATLSISLSCRDQFDLGHNRTKPIKPPESFKLSEDDGLDHNRLQAASDIFRVPLEQGDDLEFQIPSTLDSAAVMEPVGGGRRTYSAPTEHAASLVSEAKGRRGVGVQVGTESRR